MKWCGAFLVAVRLLIAWVAPDTTARYDILNAAKYLSSVQHGDLRVVFFGSSRMQSAILADEWARRARLQKDQVVNLAVNDGQLWDALYMVRSAGGLPESVDLVVIEVADWEFNRNWRSPIDGSNHTISEQIRQWGSLGDRLAVDDVVSRISLVAELVWPLSRRQRLEQWFGPRRDPLPIPPFAPLHHTDREQEAKLAKAVQFQAENIAVKHFFNPDVSSFTRRNLNELLVAVDTVSGRDIVLLQLPARRAYLRTLKDDPQGKAFYEQVQGIVASHVGDRVHVLVWEVPQDCGLKDEIFVDYGHFSRRGAEEFTDRLFYELTATKKWVKRAPETTEAAADMVAP